MSIEVLSDPKTSLFEVEYSVVIIEKLKDLKIEKLGTRRAERKKIENKRIEA